MREHRSPSGQIQIFIPSTHLRGVARLSFTARIEGAILSSNQNCFIHPHREQHPCWSHCARRARLQMTPPSSLVISQGWGLNDLPLRASNEGLPRPRVARAQKIIRLHPFLCSGNKRLAWVLLSLPFLRATRTVWLLPSHHPNDPSRQTTRGTVPLSGIVE